MTVSRTEIKWVAALIILQVHTTVQYIQVLVVIVQSGNDKLACPWVHIYTTSNKII